MPDPLLTVAELSGYRRTSLHKDVLSFVERLAPLAGGRMDVQWMGVTPEGRRLPVLVLSDHGLFTPAAAHAAADADGRPVVLILCNIHAGEVEGKEAALMLARDITTRGREALVSGATAVVVPIYNADGNDRIDPANRQVDLERMSGQYDPEEGVGTRYTGQGLNLNRDYMKLQAPESRLLSKLFGAWNPHVVVDSHTSNGSAHAYALTYDTSHTLLSGPPEPILYTRDTLLPAIGDALEARTGLRTFFYGNFRDHEDPESGWETYPGLPRYGSHYRGLTGRLDILLEAYSYAPFEDRVRVTYEILAEILTQAAARGREIVDLCARAAADTVARGRNPAPDDLVGVNYGVPRRDADGLVYDYPAHPLREVDIAAWDLEAMRQRKVRGGELTLWTNTFYARFLPEIAVRRPRGYVVPAERVDVVQHLRAHNVEVREIGDGARTAADVERYVVLAKESTVSPDVGDEERRETVLFTRRESATADLLRADHLVPMDQPLANVAIYLLEPESDDGLVRWSFFDALEPGDAYPILRVP